MTTDVEQTTRARNAIAGILSGETPNGLDPNTLGPWADTYAALRDAQTQGGTDKARAIWAALAAANPGLAALLAGAEPKAPRYTLHTAAEALEPQPPIDWIIDGLFSAGSVALLVGDPGTAKTYSMLDAAVCVALGEPWLTYTTSPGPVLVLDEESGPRRIARRLGDCLRGHDGGPDTPVYYTTLERWNLRTGEDAQHLLGAIHETGARFVVVDALVDVMPGADENAVADVHPVFMALRSIAETTGAAIVVIHHTNKAGGYRGSSAMHGAVDLLLAVKKSGADVAFDVQKARDSELFAFAALGYWQDGRFWLVPVERQAERPVFAKAESYVLRYLGEHGTSNTTAITTHADTCSDSAARRAIYSLVSKGLAQRVDPGGQGSIARWELTDQGQEAVNAYL